MFDRNASVLFAPRLYIAGCMSPQCLVVLGELAASPARRFVVCGGHSSNGSTAVQRLARRKRRTSAQPSLRRTIVIDPFKSDTCTSELQHGRLALDDKSLPFRTLCTGQSQHTVNLWCGPGLFAGLDHEN